MDSQIGSFGASSPQLQPVPEPAILAPVAEGERIEIMDALRGFALIGILMMNIEWFNRPVAAAVGFDYSLTGLDHAAGWLVRFFIEGKFYKLFSLLFGMGFAIMLIRAENRGRPTTALFLRRMLFLFVAGCAHVSFFWGGDILKDYAFTGLLLLGVVKLRSWRGFRYFHFRWLQSPGAWLKTSLIWMGLPWIVAPFAAIGFSLFHDSAKLQASWREQAQVIAALDDYDAKPAEERLRLAREYEKTKKDKREAIKKVDESTLPPAERIARQKQQSLERQMEYELRLAGERAAFTQPSYWTATKYRISSGLKSLPAMLIVTPLMIFPIFMFGFWLLRTGALQKPSEHPHLFRGMAWVGMSLGLATAAAALLLLIHPALRHLNLTLAIGNGLFGISQYLMAAGYLGTFVLLMQHDFWRRKLRFLSPLGRMALTNYLMHSVLLTAIFYGYAGNLFGHVGRAWQILIAAGIIAAQLAMCHLWLKYLRYGPMEWLWRSFTYWRVQSMRVISPSLQ